MFDLNTIKSSKFNDGGIKEVDESSIKDIAIVGMAAKFSKAENIGQFWTNIKDGKDCIREIPQSRVDDVQNYYRFMGMKSDIEFNKSAYLEEIDKFDYKFFGLSPSEANLMDPNQRLFLQTAWEAIEDSGLGGKKIRGSRTGVYLGFGGDSEYKKLVTEIEPSSLSMALPGNLKSIIPSRLSYLLDLRGPSVVFDTACSSALVATHYACQGIRNGECDVAIVGSVRFILLPSESKGGNGMESSDGITRSFDDSSDGTGGGEGVAAIVLKPLDKAIEEHDNIYAVIKGSAINQDGNSIGITAPNPEAQEDVIVRAWKDAGIDPETINYLEAHGTGTELGDPIEIEGIQRAFRRYTQKKQFCAIGTLKTNMGHLDYASGIAGLIKAVLSLKNKKIPPSLHFNRPNRNIKFYKSPVYFNDLLCNWEESQNPRRCCVSAFGISGTNCHLVLEEAPKIIDSICSSTEKLNVLTISAKSKESLEVIVKKYEYFLEKNKEINVEDICYTANTGREHYNFRIAIICRNIVDLANRIRRINCHEFEGEGIYFSEKECELNDNKDSSDISKKVKARVSQFLSCSGNENKLLEEICKLYVMGAEINWDDFYEEDRIRVSLPTYAFERTRCWINIPKDSPKYNSERIEDHKTANSQESEFRLVGRNTNEGFTDTEMILGKAWGRVLGFTEISVDDDFFELGGHSVLAIKLEVELRKENIEISYKDIYKFSTISKLARYLSEGSECNIEKNKILEGIEPFNEIYYQNCFYNSAFPVLRHYKKSELSFLTNDIIVYHYDEDKKALGLGTNYIPFQTIEHIVDLEGISVNTQIDSDNIILDIITSIRKERPVIIWVDCFYESIRKDMYLKEHWPHTLLIYGYDESRQIFNIIEHKDRDNLSYDRYTISYADIIKCYKGYLNYFQKCEAIPTYYEFSLKEEVPFGESSDKVINNYFEVYKSNMMNKKDLVLDGLSMLKKFTNDFEVVALNETMLKDISGDLLGKFNNIINTKMVERYRNQVVLVDQPDLLSIFEDIVDNWNSIRATIARLFYSSDYRLKSIETLLKKLEAICQLEEKYYEQIYKLVNSNLPTQ